MLHIGAGGVYTKVDNILKIYPTKYQILIFKKPPTIIPEGWEPDIKPPKKSLHKIIVDENNLKKTLSRSKTTIQDIVLCNNFSQFVTFTFKDDRYDIEKCKQKLSKWIKNQKKIRGDFQYILVPEFHKDHKAIHFHGLLQNYKGKLKLAKDYKNKLPIYNITSYRLGFSTLTHIESQEKVSSYIRKYITKDMPTMGKNKKRFWTSQHLKRPLKVQNIHSKPHLYTQLMQNAQLKYDNDILTCYENSGIISLQQLKE
jgi:hypothetical protein